MLRTIETVVQQLAHEFIAAFEALRDLIGTTAALLDERVQAARRNYQRSRLA